ncbi:MAG: hypothetical protein K0Q95_2493 [Bacteroidota bacterium]|nr:hypothetical protein [Bacteroidota bacterium]
MEDQKNLNISIPKPCHEDWNKMTPNERGAFCGKCAKTVVDFTKKSTKEIQIFFQGRSEKKTCGRFLSTQLNSPTKSIDLVIPLNLLPRNLTFNKAFAFALFITFGTALFSCSTQKGEVVGKIAVTDTSHSVQRTTTANGPDSSTHMINGEAVPLKCTLQKGDVDISPMLGEVTIPNDTIQQEIDSVNSGNIKTGELKIQK